MKRGFISLSPQEALGVAISIEERNAGIYHRFAEMFTEFGDEESLDIAGVFWEMAVEERGHKALLQHKYEERYGDTPCALTEADLVEFVEVPRLENGDVFETGGDNTSGRARALRVALHAELSAQRFYGRLAEQTVAGPLRKIYSDLANMEDEHVAYLEARLSQDYSPTSTVH
jgi:erythrin-vacuolar iron transport family protein